MSPEAPESPDELVGSWRLEAYLSVGENGGVSEGPLGPHPEGLLIYSPDGHMSVSMMRADHEPSRGGSPVTRFMGYAGTWRLDGQRVVHEVTVSSHSYMVGTRQVRDLSLDDGLLTLSGSARAAGGPPERRVLTWRRAGADADGGRL